MTEMKLVEGEISTEDWEFPFGKLNKAISPGVTEAVRNSLTEIPPYLTLHLGKRGDPTSPIALRLSLAAFQGPSSLEPVWELPIKSMIDNSFGEDLDQDGKIHPCDTEWAIILRDKLSELVSQIEAMIP